MAYKVEITPAAQRTIKKLPKNIQRKLIEIISQLNLRDRTQAAILATQYKLFQLQNSNFEADF